MTCDLAVYHLVRRTNGLAPLARFLDSYRRHLAGLDHELVFILKGFSNNRIDRDVDGLLQGVSHRCLMVGDWGYDITAYFKAAEQDHPQFLCFMNSFSEILADDWLLKLYRALCIPNAGAAGATGSYQGFNPDWRSMPDAEVLAVRPRWKQKLLELPLIERANRFRRKIQFPVFPNPHLRTNAFLIRRTDMLALLPHRTLTKRKAYSFESGRRSMTAQLLRSGKEVYVVGSDGRAYPVSDWMRSRTFWLDEQQNLLVADNQTRRYQNASGRERKVFTWYAWGTEGLRETACPAFASERIRP